MDVLGKRRGARRLCILASLHHVQFLVLVHRLTQVYTRTPVNEQVDVPLICAGIKKYPGGVPSTVVNHWI
jgi:hypothetical protein